MIWALSSADRVLELGLAWKRLWKACMAQAVTSCRRHTDSAKKYKVHSCPGAFQLLFHYTSYMESTGPLDSQTP